MASMEALGLKLDEISRWNCCGGVYSLADDDLTVDVSSEPGSVIENRMTLDKVRRAIMNLPPDHRTVIELRFLEQWSHEDVSDALGKSVEATRSLQYRALGKLREMLFDENLIT